jgi:uncharacterized glyoxalase superfamily protein PhnB
VAAIVPLLTVDDVPATVDYYEGKLGFAREFVHPPDGPVFATVRYEGARLMFEAAAGFAAKYGMEAAVWPRGRGVDLNVAMDGAIDAFYDRVRAAGAEIVRPIFTTGYGMRQFTVRDLNGYLLTFIKHEE